MTTKSHYTPWACTCLWQTSILTWNLKTPRENFESHWRKPRLLRRKASGLWRDKRFARQVLSSALAADVFAVAYDDAPAQKHGPRHALHLHAFVGSVVDALVLVDGADGQGFVGIEDDEVGVAAGGYSAFAREEAKEFRRHGGDQVDEVIECEPALAHALVEQHHAVLDSRQTVGNFREVLATEFFLAVKVKGRVIGGDDGEFAALQAMPESLVIGPAAQRRRAAYFAPSKSGAS